ncbi:hypothetical protein [Persephonella sp.]
MNKEPILLKQVDLFSIDYNNRSVSFKELIYDNYSYNRILINIDPDGYEYKIRFFDKGYSSLLEDYYLYKYVVGAYPFEGDEGILTFKFANTPFMRTKDKLGILAVFIYKRFKEKDKKYYLPLLLVDVEKEELIIEKMAHDILLNSSIPGEAEFKIREHMYEIYKITE